MPAPRGNQNAKGHGRPTKNEAQDLNEWLLELWEGCGMSVPELEKKIKSGKYGVKHIAYLKALTGNEKVLIKIMDRILPPTVKWAKEQELDLELDETDEEAARRVVEMLEGTWWDNQREKEVQAKALSQNSQD